MRARNKGRKWYSLTLILCGLWAAHPLVDAQQRGGTQVDSLSVVPRQLMLPRQASDLNHADSPFAPRTPSNVRTTFEYDPKTGLYLLRTYLGDQPLGTPIPYTAREFARYMSARQDAHYFNHLNREASQQKPKTKAFNPLDMEFGLGAAERIFGPGGVRLRLTGSAEVSAGIRSTRTDNPSLSERARNNTYFDFDEKIQAGVQASVGNKLNFNLNYNTESTFDFDARKLKLGFEGEEDDIIKLIEAGNVSMQPKNSLINGGGALFGLHSKMQFGRLKLDMLVSQQRTQRKRISTGGGAQTATFEVNASAFEENRHFFLSEYFRSQYNGALASLPYVRSSVKINRVEVWVTNKRGHYNDARNVVAFADLGEAQSIHSTSIALTNGGVYQPRNAANSLYSTIVGEGALRHSDQVTGTIGTRFRSGLDYEKVESARRLSESDYTLNEVLGYITLNTRLATDEVLGVAFEYTYNGQVYRVGEFSSDRPDASGDNLFVKLLKGTNMSPDAPYWHFMMRNVYSLGSGVYNLQSEDFKLDIYYRSDATGGYIPYLPSGSRQGERFMTLMGLDKMNRERQPYSDGRFDYLDGVTINAAKGLVYLPTVEPFGATLRAQGVENSFVYDELYSQTLVSAQQISEKNKYVLRGEYRASRSGEISLGAMNVAPGTVRVTAGGVTLVENVDYTVDYLAGTVRIINEQISASRTPVDVSLEDSGGFGTQRKTMLGVDLGYELSRNLHLGATAMYLGEMPLTTKTALGNESMQNFIWGANVSWRHKSQWLTNLVGKLPFVNISTPSQISLDAEFAHLVPGHYKSSYSQGYSYLDDFESSRSEIDVMNPYAWSLASVPADRVTPSMAMLATGYGRAHLSWFTIDPLFTRENNSLTPSYIRNNPDLVSNHYVREVEMRELFPYRDVNANQLSYLQTLNLHYYPAERGPYNLNIDRLGADGRFVDPNNSWAGIMRKIDQTDFESSNIEYLEFWLMDPFAYDRGVAGGDLYFNIGDISEDILRDEKKFFENGLPISPEHNLTIANTDWGRVPTQPSVGYSFDNAVGARAKQDVGLNGLSTEEEMTHPSYADYLTRLRTAVSPTTLTAWASDAFSPLNDPGGDNFHHYRGVNYDANRLPIIERYKRFNGTEGNSAESTGGDLYSVASRVTPDVEDINQDNSLNELNRYYEYRISLRPPDMRVGTNYIVSSREAEVALRNGRTERVTWYQFKIPLEQYTSAIGGINDRRSMRFMRMYLANFSQEVDVRFGSLRLVRGDWRVYTHSLADVGVPSSHNTKLTVSSVNIEEHGDRSPVNYVLPPGVPRSLDAQQAQSTQLNEQAISLKVQDLSSGDARAIYCNTSYDLRRYRKLQLYAHAEQLVEANTNTEDGELSVFIRLGSDYRSNYYEYSVPLRITPPGTYNGNLESDQRRVWPDANQINLNLERLTDLKRKRNASINDGTGASLYEVFSAPDTEATNNTISVLGNPSLSNIRTIMIGVRNNSGQTRSLEVWANELRVGDYNESGGWAANANLGVQLADLGAINLRGQLSTAGFGSIDQSLSERQIDDRSNINLASNIQIGKFFPESIRANIPLYFTYTDERSTPQYSPNDEDILLKDALSAATKPSEKKAIEDYALTRRTTQSVTLSGVSIGIKSRDPMPYDPANLSLSFSHSTSDQQSPDIEYQHQLNWQAGITYDYTPTFQPIKPFKSIKGKGQLSRYLQNYGLNLWPARLNLQTTMMRSYEEEQVRNQIDDTSGLKLPVTFAQQFVWYRKLNLTWNLTPNLVLSMTAGTDARIEAPHVQVNRSLNPDDYAVWREAVDRSIAHLGTPQHYGQTATATYTLPTQTVKPFSWITSSLNYSSSYNWDLGAELPVQRVRLANTIANQINLEVSTQLRLRSLYGLSSYLSELDRRFSTASARPKVKTKPTPYKRSVVLLPDSATRIQHGLSTRSLRLVAKDSTGRIRPISFKAIDANAIELRGGADTLSLEVVITPRTGKTMDETLKAILDRAVYTLTMVKDVSLSYRTTNSTHLPGFLPNIGAAFGQGSGAGGMSPGLGFAFGFTGSDFIDQAAERGWLSTDAEQVRPGVFSRATVVDLKATLQPIRDLTIMLTGNYTQSERTEHQYMFPGRPRLGGGDLTMTTIGLRGFFSLGNAASGYSSAVFERFLAARQTIIERYTQALSGQTYPAAGFLSEGGWAGKSVVDHIQTDLNSSAVLLPAFRSAYTQAAAPGAISLNPLPTLLSLLPNWTVTYNGLSRLEPLKELFRNVALRHAYRGTFRIDSYSSFPSWVGADGGAIGFLPNEAALGGSPRLSIPFDIATVTVQENFFPLIGLDVTFSNGLTLTTQWRRSRAASLGLTAYRIIETMSNEFNVGASYKIADLRALFSPTKGRRSRSSAEATSTAPKGLNLRADYSYRQSLSLIRQIQRGYTQATSGNADSRLSVSAEYDLSRMLTLRAYYELTHNRPLVSTSSFPVVNAAYGLTLRFNLTQ